MMEYKGYVAQIEYDDSVQALHGRVLNTRDVISFEAESAKEVQQAFHEAVDDYLAWCVERGEEPEKPYSGTFLVRGDPELHRAVSTAAARAHKSVNAWVSEALRRAAGVG
ncbi:MAG TPA: type II toxin-antitoxin system HicB family antitoxin [Longimicrobiaceae bacterium]|nr:type II toxin-antitoxin system HicB family antitoxin [Longimicrobiaceae bacterium]